MKHILWIIPLILFFWAIVKGGTTKKMPHPPDYNSDDEVQL
jgi:hypothetical protein